jgi:hypothetical protein
VNVIGDPQELARRPASGKNEKQDTLSMDAAVAGAAGLVRRSTATASQPSRSEALKILLRRRGRATSPAQAADPEVPQP